MARGVGRAGSQIGRLRLKVVVPLVVSVTLGLGPLPVALADATEAEFTEDIAHWNSLGGQIPGKPSNWRSAAQTVCEGAAELQNGGLSAYEALNAQVRAAVDGGWFKRDAVYFVTRAIVGFCPELRPHG